MFKKQECTVYKNLAFVLKKLYKVNRALFVLKMPSILLGVILSLSNAFFLRIIINELVNKGQMKTVILYSVCFALATLGVEIVTRLLGTLNDIQKEKTKCNVKFFLAKKMSTLPLNIIEDPKMKNFISMAEQSDSFVTIIDYSMGIFSAIAGLAIYSAIVLTAQPPIIFVMIATAVFQLVVLKYRNTHEHQWRRRNTPEHRKLFYYYDILRNHKYGKELRVNGLQDYFNNKAVKQYHEQCLPLARKNSKERNAFLGVTQIAKDIQNMAIYGLLAVKVIFGNMPVGDFVMYLNCTQRLGGYISELVDNYSGLMTCGLFAEEFRYCIELSDQQYCLETKSFGNDCVPDLEFRNVSFQYPDTARFVLRHISFHVSSGERLSLVGENGSGKSTLIKLICGFYMPTEGDIFIGGINTKYISRPDYSKLLAAVFQDFQLLSFSVKDNITMGAESEDMRLEQSMQNSGIADRIALLSDGINTFVSKEFNSDGVEFSGGERQKIAIARAIYKNAPLIILDEPTASLDPIAEYEVFKQFDSLSKGKTAIYVSHRLSATRFADKIAVLRAGEVCEFGTHESLMAKQNGTYAALFNAQAQYYK